MDSRIYHIATAEEWRHQLHENTYAPSAFQTEHFVHACTEGQIEGVLNRYFAGRKDLLLLTLETGKLSSTVKYEVSTGNELFPHIFGRINKNAIVSVREI